MLKTVTSHVTNQLTGQVWYAVTCLARRADSYLAQEAARNAAAAIAVARSSRRLEEVRALRDLRQLELGERPLLAQPKGTATGRLR
jgi:hypothetical protein